MGSEQETDVQGDEVRHGEHVPGLHHGRVVSLFRDAFDHQTRSIRS